MSHRNLSSLGVGDVLFSAEFCLAPQDVLAWKHGQMLEGHEDRSGPRSRIDRPPAVGSSVPQGLVFARALDAVGRSSGVAGSRFEQTSMGKLRALRPARVGETLTCVATVRYRSEREGRCFMTLAIEVRGVERTVAEVEVGVELSGNLHEGLSLVQAA